MTEQDNWGTEKPRKVYDGDVEVSIWKIDWGKLPPYDDYEVDNDD